jgi:hypothetical protein
LAIAGWEVQMEKGASSQKGFTAQLNGAILCMMTLKCIMHRIKDRQFPNFKSITETAECEVSAK